MGQGIKRVVGGSGLLLSLASLGCDDGEVYTEQRQVRMTIDLQPGGSFSSGDAIVAGSYVCPEITGSDLAPDANAEEVAACYQWQVGGPAQLDEDGCLSLSAAGRVELSLLRRACALDEAFGDDRVVFEVLQPDGVVAAFEYAAVPPTVLRGEAVRIEAPDAFPPGEIAAPGEPVYVFEGEASSVDAYLLRSDDATAVRYTDGIAHGELVAGTTEPNPADGPRTSVPFDGVAGDVIFVTLEAADRSYDVGEVRVVGRDAIASLELYPTVARIGEGDDALQVGARAIVRDAEGHVLREPPISWTRRDVDGTATPIGPDLDDDGHREPSPAVGLGELCVDAEAGEWREATLEGHIDGRDATVDVRWQCVDDHTPGCTCRAGRSTPGWTGLVALFVLVARRRRRR
jgi:MYXO-CTERM domain-containing protein